MNIKVPATIKKINQQIRELHIQTHPYLDLPKIRKDWPNLRRRLLRHLALRERLAQHSRELHDFACTARAFAEAVTKQPAPAKLKRAVRKGDRKTDADFFADLAQGIRQIPPQAAALLAHKMQKPLTHYRRLIRQWQVAARDAARYGENNFQAESKKARELARLLASLDSKH